MWGSCEEALAVARDAHWQALVAAALLEDKVERLSCSLSCSHQCSGSHRCSGSCRQRPQAGSHQNKAPQVDACKEESSRRSAQSPSPVWLRQWVTFEDSPGEDVRGEEPPLLAWADDKGTGEPSDWSQPEPRMEEEDLECPPTLDPWVQEFLAGEVSWASNRSEDNPQQTLMPELSPQRNNEWIHWCTQHVEMPTCKSSEKFLARMTSRNLPRGCGCLFRYQKWDAVPPR